MKGGMLTLTKETAKRFLNVCRATDAIKFASIIKQNNISYAAVSRFLNTDDSDDMISLIKLAKICNDIYNLSGFINDMYKEIILEEKIV